MAGNQPFYYLFCNHWTQGGIGFAFPSGWYNGKKYDRTFSTAYTIHKMLDAADDFPGLKVSMELDSYSYEEVLKEDPDCIQRLKQYIQAGKAGVDGGTYGQPFGQDYGWEPNIRQLTYGRKVVQDLLDYEVKAFLVEEQWFHPQLPQVLRKSGYHYASLQNQNSGQVKPMNLSMMNWVGIDNTKIPAIPANDLMVSCVRQYTGYDEYRERLDAYERPLLFQWVEVWPPGMDWGASALPFEKAIRQVQEWGGLSVTLGDYFEREAQNRALEDVYIALDESNYKNNWYQGGGWGYDGDQVIIWDKKAEQSLLAYETLAATFHFSSPFAYPKEALNRLWKKLLILQNHDFSVARSYRAITEDGVETNAGSLGVSEYKKLLNECKSRTEVLLKDWFADEANPASILVPNYTGIPAVKTVAFEIERSKGKPFALEQDGEAVPYDILHESDGRIRGLMSVKLPDAGIAAVRLKECDSEPELPGNNVRCGKDWIEDAQNRIEWKKNSWAIKIRNKKTDEHIEFTGFTGPIGKVNEHDAGRFHALSPGHKIFTFEFDGTTHSPDQLSVSRIEPRIESIGTVQSTLVLHADLLTLHTTEIPVAFAEARVTINHITGKIDCSSYFYSGVYLSLQCHAVFKHELPNGKYFRDFPFGEEETHHEESYTNSYFRVNSGRRGFTLIHHGTQKVQLVNKRDGGEIRHLIARDTVRGEYEWKFTLHFGSHQPWESARLSKTEQAVHHCMAANGPSSDISFLEVQDERIILSAIYQENNRIHIRLVNYSNDALEEVPIQIREKASHGEIVDFNGKCLNEGKLVMRDHSDGTILQLSFQPWEIATIALRQ